MSTKVNIIEIQLFVYSKLNSMFGVQSSFLLTLEQYDFSHYQVMVIHLSQTIQGFKQVQVHVPMRLLSLYDIKQRKVNPFSVLEPSLT